MGCCDVKGLIPLQDALNKLQESVSNNCEVISLPLSSALGYALAVDIKSPLNVPPFNNSAMDGYALNVVDLENCSSEQPISLALVGKSFAGAPYNGDLAKGECIRIMTGAV
ncbi:MAG TPA: molybdopterin molybdenumtransferase MoeA, partial [Psychromonas hadalis]|nr:molybdopterin molybdenumtransferase MoeA [Psychromonas hadalis]